MKINKHKTQTELNKAQIELTLSESILNKIETDLLPTKEALNLVANLAKTGLVEVEKKIKSIDLELKRVKEKLHQQEQKSRITLNVSDILTDLMPIMKTECHYERKNTNRIHVTLTLFNYGKHKFSVSAPTIQTRDPSNKQWEKMKALR